VSAFETYQYATLRIVPQIERGEFINAGILVFSRRLKFLRARILLDQERLRALAPDLDVTAVESHLRIREWIASGDPRGGPVSTQPQSERFGWLVAPSSTVIQPSEVHTGLCSNPDAILEHLFTKLVVKSPAV